MPREGHFTEVKKGEGMLFFAAPMIKAIAEVGNPSQPGMDIRVQGRIIDLSRTTEEVKTIEDEYRHVKYFRWVPELPEQLLIIEMNELCDVTEVTTETDQKLGSRRSFQVTVSVKKVKRLMQAIGPGGNAIAGRVMGLETWRALLQDDIELRNIIEGKT